jgi:5-methylcytosine-specific restriction endonuclease McrA
VRKQSKKRAAADREYRKIAKRLLEERPWCQRCQQRSVLIHHIVPRSQWPGGLLIESNMAALCLNCHGEIHAHPAKAKEEQWLKSKPANITTS